jgi:HlyD family secretion protein
MELLVAVDEADVSLVAEGQRASFGVDAWPGRAFQAEVVQVRYGADALEGVVTYGALLRVDNPERLLRPGMTATAEITTIEHKDVLLVPNAAVRFTPPADAAPAQRGSVVSRLLPRPPRFGTRPKSSNGKNGKEGAGQVYVLRDGVPVAVPVTIGPSNGRLTEVTSSELAAGTPVITEALGAAAS